MVFIVISIHPTISPSIYVSIYSSATAIMPSSSFFFPNPTRYERLLSEKILLKPKLRREIVKGGKLKLIKKMKWRTMIKMNWMWWAYKIYWNGSTLYLSMYVLCVYVCVCIFRCIRRKKPDFVIIIQWARGYIHSNLQIIFVMRNFFLSHDFDEITFTLNALLWIIFGLLFSVFLLLDSITTCFVDPKAWKTPAPHPHT